MNEAQAEKLLEVLGELTDRVSALSAEVQVRVTVDLDDNVADELRRTTRALQGIEDSVVRRG